MSRPAPAAAPIPGEPVQRLKKARGFSDQMRVLRYLSGYLWPAREPAMQARTVAAGLLIILAKLANVSVPYFFKRAIDALSGHAAPAMPVLIASVPISFVVLYGISRLVAQTTGELRSIVFSPVEQRTVRVLSLDVFRHLHALSLRYHLERQTGGLSRVLERGSAAVETVTSALLFNIGPTIFELLLVTIVLWRGYRPVFALVILGTIAIYVALTILITRWRSKYRRAMNELEAEAAAKVVDSLLNYETVKYFGNEAHEERRFEGSRRAYEKAALKSERTLFFLNTVQNIIIALGLIAIMTLAARGIAAGTLSLGDFVLVNGYLLQLYQPLNQLGIVYRTVNQALIDLEAMYSVLNIGAEVKDAPDAEPLGPLRQAISFETVGFAYEGRRPILQGINFTLPLGHTVALVGSSGAGKSTIARLLFRFYDPTSGRIALDGQDIRGVTQASLRQAIGVVPQDTVLFNDTIFYNIAYGRPEATPAEVMEAARLAHILHFIESLPDGWETKVGERGLKLSGGEKQRVAIARVILKNPQILIFDEATSALDTHTEEEIQANLREVSANRTTLVIAHRLSTVVDADEILVLEEGRVIERGTHNRLLRQQGAYAALWNRQRRAAEGDLEVAE